MTNENEQKAGFWRMRSNSECRACGTFIAKGTQAWFAWNNGARCASCGPHPGLPTSTPRGPRHAPTQTPAPAAPVAAPVANVPDYTHVIASLRARCDSLEDSLTQLRILAETRAQVIEVRQGDGVKVAIEGAHASFAEVVKLVSAGLDNIFLQGPAGSGKTTLAAQVAKALALPFGFLSFSAGTSESKLTGNLRPQADGTWAWFTPMFVTIFEEGGVFLLDEMDAADSNVLVSVNAALANGELEVDGRIVKRSPKCVIIAAANTFGTGADAMYVGRNQLDSATLDRFIGAIVVVTYDRKVEERMALAAGANGRAFVEWIWTARDRAQSAQLKRVIGTRMVQAGVKLLNGGFTLAETKARMTTGWSAAELRKIEAN